MVFLCEGKGTKSQVNWALHTFGFWMPALAGVSIRWLLIGTKGKSLGIKIKEVVEVLV